MGWPKFQLIDNEVLIQTGRQETHLTWILVTDAKVANFTRLMKVMKGLGYFFWFHQGIWPM